MSIDSRRPESLLGERRVEVLEGFYEKEVAVQNTGADPELVKQTATKLVELTSPLLQEVISGDMTYFQISTEIDGLEVQINYEREG